MVEIWPQQLLAEGGQQGKNRSTLSLDDFAKKKAAAPKRRCLTSND